MHSLSYGRRLIYTDIAVGTLQEKQKAGNNNADNRLVACTFRNGTQMLRSDEASGTRAFVNRLDGLGCFGDTFSAYEGNRIKKCFADNRRRTVIHNRGNTFCDRCEEKIFSLHIPYFCKCGCNSSVYRNNRYIKMKKQFSEYYYTLFSFGNSAHCTLFPNELCFFSKLLKAVSNLFGIPFEIRYCLILYFFILVLY